MKAFGNSIMIDVTKGFLNDSISAEFEKRGRTLHVSFVFTAESEERKKA
jgi:hypothetical protein